MPKVRFTGGDRRIVRTGDAHGTLFRDGDESDDTYVCEVALRNGWGVDVSAPAVTASPDRPADKAALDPPPRKARRHAPENK